MEGPEKNYESTLQGTEGRAAPKVFDLFKSEYAAQSAEKRANIAAQSRLGVAGLRQQGPPVTPEFDADSKSVAAQMRAEGDEMGALTLESLIASGNVDQATKFLKGYAFKQADRTAKMGLLEASMQWRQQLAREGFQLREKLAQMAASAREGKLRQDQTREMNVRIDKAFTGANLRLNHATKLAQDPMTPPDIRQRALSEMQMLEQTVQYYDEMRRAVVNMNDELTAQNKPNLPWEDNDRLAKRMQELWGKNNPGKQPPAKGSKAARELLDQARKELYRDRLRD